MSAAAANLESSTRDLLVSWDHARNAWRDAKSQQFAQQFVEPIPDLVFQARDAMSHLEALLRKIKHDCE